jgi:dUTP pyrophosphatase
VSPEVRVVRLVHAIGLPLPSYATRRSAGADLVAAVDQPVVLEAGERRAIPTGLIMEIPDGYEGQVRPRSGLALRQGLTVANAPGTVDSDYRGEVKVLLVNLGAEPVTITRGDRIAQLVIAPVERAQFTEAGYLVPTDRGAGGFGSTGA